MTTNHPHHTHLLDLPADILRDITQPAYIGKSTQCMLLLTSKQLAAVVGPDVQPVNVCQYAARDGHLDILTYTVPAGHIPASASYTAAASRGHLHIIEYLRQIKCPWHPEAAEAAVAAGHLHIFQFIREQDLAYTRQAIMNAAVYGHLHIIEYIHTHGILVNNSHHYHTKSAYFDITELCKPAAEHGHIHILDWFVQKQIRDAFDMFWFALPGAIIEGRIDVLEWMVRNGAYLDAHWYDIATYHHQLHILDWLYLRSCPGAHQVRMIAQWNGLLDVIEWADAKGI